MKHGKLLILVLTVVGCLYAAPNAKAQTASPTASPTVTPTSVPCAFSTPTVAKPTSCCKTTISVTNPPVSVIPVWAKTSLCVTLWSSPAENVLIFPYADPIPGTASSTNLHELSTQNPSYCETVSIVRPTGANNINNGWGAVLESAGAGTVVDGCIFREM
jgi:hypothetical protein